MIVEFTTYIESVPITTNAVNSNSSHGDVYSIQHYVIKVVSDLLQRSVVFLRGLRIPPRIKLTTTIYWNNVESGVNLRNIQAILVRILVIYSHVFIKMSHTHTHKHTPTPPTHTPGAHEVPPVVSPSAVTWSLRFSQFSGCWLILSVYIIMSF